MAATSGQSGGAAIAALTTTAVNGAQATVLAALKSNGVDATALGNPITGSLVAASAGTAGNALDQVLDKLRLKLVSSAVTLAELTSALRQNVPTATSASTPSVALEVALQPKAATCDALRSGSYRFVGPVVGSVGSHGSESTQFIRIDASAMTLTNPANDSFTVLTMAGSPCRFTTSGGGDFVVSPSGALAIKTGRRLGVCHGLPRANHRAG